MNRGSTDTIRLNRGARRTTLPALLHRWSLVAFLFVGACQHARVELAPALVSPGQRRPAPSTAETGRAVREQNRLVLKQRYFAWGLLPRERTYSEEELCPSRGIKVIHQFHTAGDILAEQLTLGVYSPRTLEIQCY